MLHWLKLHAANSPMNCYTDTQNRRKKLGQQSAICWNYLGLFRDYDLDHIILRNKTFLFEKEFRETLQNFNSFSSLRQFLFLFFLLVVQLR